MSVLDKVVEAGTDEFYADYTSEEVIAEIVDSYKDFGSLVSELLSRMGSEEADGIMLEATAMVLEMYIAENI